MQRKLNTRFLVVLTVVVVGGVVVAVFGGGYLSKGTAQKHIQMAELYAREQRLADAAEEYKLAIQLDRRNPEVYLKLGDVLHQLVRSDFTVIDKDKQYWNLALEADPSYLPAMTRLLDAYLEDSQIWPGPVSFSRVRDICSRIAAIDPTDSRAKANLHIAWLQGWMSGVETSPPQIDESLRELAALQEKDPSNIDVPFILARGRLNKALGFMGEERREAAMAQITDAEAAMQQAVANNPENPRAQLRNSQVLMAIGDLLRKDVEKRRQYRAMAAASITRAQELVKKDDSAFMEVTMVAASMAHQDHKIEQAEKLYREMLARRPDDRSVRIALAQLLVSDPSKRQDAIALLEEETGDQSNQSIMQIRQRTGMLVKTQVVLAGLRIDALAASKSDDEKKELLEKINGHLTEIYNRAGESPEYLRLKGRLFQAQNQYVDAIQTYNRAAAMMAQLGQPQDDDMMYQLSRVYIMAQQTGEARNILEDLVRRYENFIPARMLLCRVLLAEGNRDKAAPHLAYLEKYAPEDPQVTALLLAAASTGQESADRSGMLLGKLPEGSRDERIAKAHAAFDAGQTAVAQRLANEVLAANAADEEAAQVAIQALVKLNRTDDARRAVDAALAASPDSRSLKMMKAQLDGANDQVVELVEENIEQIKDEFVRELARARLAESRNKPEEQLAHLKKAEALKPDSSEVWDQLFQFHATRKEWEKLQPYLDKLTNANTDKAGGLFYQFRLAMAQGDTDRAVETARQLTVKLPEFAQSWLAFGQGLQAARKYDEAKDAFLRVIEKTPMNFEAYRGLVEVSYLRRQFDDAGRFISEARKRMPNNVVLRNMEIEHELNFGRPERVIGLIEAQFAKAQDKPEGWIMLGRAYERIFQRKAARNDDEGKVWAGRLREHYGKAFEKWPENSDFAGRYADACAILNDRSAAEAVLLKHVEKSGHSAEAVTMLADYYTRGGEASRAEQMLQLAIERNRDRMELWQRLATVQLGQGKVDQALQTLDLAPKQDQVLMQKLEIMLNAGKIAQAKEMIAAALKTRGEDFGLVNAQAYIALQENNLKAAREFSEKSLAIQPNNPIALHQRALARLRENPADVDGAIIDLKMAIQQAANNVELRLTTAEAYLKRRDPDSAIRELELAVQIAPRNSQTWSRLLELYLSATPPRLDEAKALIEQVRAAGSGAGDLNLTLQAARVAQMRRDAGTAVIEMRKALAMSNGNASLTRDYMAMLLDLQQYDHLLKESEQLLQQAPGEWWIYNMRATAKARLGAKDEALGEWEKALGLADKAKDDRGALLVMEGVARELGVSQVIDRVLERAKTEPRWMIFAAWLYQSAHDWKNAVAMVEQAMASLDKFSKDEQLRVLQVAGGIYLAAEPSMTDKAVSTYQRLLAQTPDDLSTLNNLACLLIDNVKPADPTKALEYSQRAFDTMRNRGLTEPLLMDTHGWVLVHNGKVQEGIVLLQEVVQRRPFLEARYHLAEAYLLGKYGDSAVRQLNEANQMIADAAAKRQTVDPELKTKIDQAMARAVAMAKEQSSGGNP